MSGFAITSLIRYVELIRSNYVHSAWHELRAASLRPPRSFSSQFARALNTNAGANEVPFRKQLKDEAKRAREAKRSAAKKGLPGKHETKEYNAEVDKWKLTVGLEIHAQLNTEKKLFSSAKASDNDDPNRNVALFDLALPGSQPDFQQATLIPALRAAIGLSCSIQKRSKFDRKHYYYQDQPSGYQITQFYEPFAKDGMVTLYDHDGIAPADGDSINIEIKQIQMEQDTAKSALHPPSTALLDFNRVGYPLIEIITHPQIHHPQTAAACVKKLQAVLQTVNAVTAGMQSGGLRADVNVSVSPAGSMTLGQRTEIKNLSSIKAVEDAIIAERDRQISVLEAGGRIEGETRGWALGSTETTKLRGKEGEVDYRYMPDPDISPVFISEDLVDRIGATLPMLPDELIADLVAKGLTTNDAKTLASLDDGARLDYFDEVMTEWEKLYWLWASHDASPKLAASNEKIAANWILHELGGLLSAANTPFSSTCVAPKSMAQILFNVHNGTITGPSAKHTLAMIFNGDKREVNAIIQAEKLQPLPRQQYVAMAQALIDENGEKVKQIKEKKQLGKLKWFVGQMMRQDRNVEAQKAEQALRELLEI